MRKSGDKTAKRKEKKPCQNKNKPGLKSESKKEKKIEPGNDGKNEVIVGAKPFPIKIVNKVMKAICKITIQIKERVARGTGFFLNYSDTLKCLMTNYHVINPSLEKENIEIEIHNQKKNEIKI